MLMFCFFDRCMMLSSCRLTRQYKHDGPHGNTGLVMSRKVAYVSSSDMSVKVVITATFLKEPVTFTCNCKLSHRIVSR